MHLEKNPTRQRWVSIVLVAALCGYPLLGTLVASTDLSSLTASVPIRLFVLLASVFVLMSMRMHKPSMSSMLLWSFWCIYIIRLIWDSLVVQIPGATAALLTFSLTCMLPASAMLRTKAIDEERTAKLILFCGVATGAIAIALTVFLPGNDRSLIALTGRLSFDTVNPITYGHVAVSTLISGLALWNRSPTRTGIIILWISATVSIATLEMAASRGPALALLVCLFASAIFHSKLRLALFTFAIVIVVFIFKFQSGGALEDRIINVHSDPSTNERLLVQTNALNQFLENPVTGSAYIEREMMIYPHNPFIEAAMATGAFGLAIFTMIFMILIHRIIQLLRRGEVLVPLLALQYTVGSMLSGSLYLSTSMWMLFALMLSKGVMISNTQSANFRLNRWPAALAK